MDLSYEVFRYIFIGAAIASGLLLATSIVLFFVLRIPKVVSDLSGRTAKKAIEAIRMQNEQTGDKAYKSSAVNMQRGKVTDKISPSGRLQQREETPFGTGRITEKISTSRLSREDLGETTVLASEGGETTVLDSGYGETTVLGGEYGETTVLGAQEMQPQPQMPIQAQQFTVEYEITYIHTSEVIA